MNIYKEQPYNEKLILNYDEIKKIPDKECCLVCSIICCFNTIFIGIMFTLIHEEDINLNSTIF